MKTPVALGLLLTLTLICHDALGQARAGVNFDLRPESSNSGNFAGSTRSRRAGNATAPSIASAGSVERQIFVLINAERAKNGLSELEWNDGLAELARVHSQ